MYWKSILQRSKSFIDVSIARWSACRERTNFHLSGDAECFAPSRQQFVSAKKRLEHILLDNIIPFWFPGALDNVHGGYRVNHDLHGQWKVPSIRHLVSQARTLWFFSHLFQSPWGNESYLDAARHGFDFLRNVIWDPEHGGFYRTIQAENPSAQDMAKDIYGQAFGLYALSEYVKASKDPVALELASHLFGLLEKHVHDSRYGGYYDVCTREWHLVPSKIRFSSGAALTVKRMNTHLHLMEALTTYYSVSRDPIARERLIELLFILSNAVVRKRLGACTDKYFSNWAPLVGPDHEIVSYGHDLEIIWLMSHTCSVVNLPLEPLFDLYGTLYDYAYQFGFDHQAGGFYEKGFFNKAAHGREKVWWVQAEGLVSMLHLFHLSNKEQFWQCFIKCLDWIHERQVNWESGEWYERIEPNGQPSPGRAGSWKSPYHNGRAMIQCLDILNQLTD